MFGSVIWDGATLILAYTSFSFGISKFMFGSRVVYKAWGLNYGGSQKYADCWIELSRATHAISKYILECRLRNPYHIYGVCTGQGHPQAPT